MQGIACQTLLAWFQEFPGPLILHILVKAFAAAQLCDLALSP